MTWPQRPGQPTEDDDPTGVRALLAALPDPGPMPDDVAERVLARLAQAEGEAQGELTSGGEHSGQAGRWAGPHGAALDSATADGAFDADDSQGLSVLPFETVVESRRPVRGRRPSWPILGGVAAGLLAIAIGGGAVLSALNRESPAASAERNASGSAAAPLAADSGQQVGGRPVHVQMSGHAYTEAGLTREAQDIIEAPAAAVSLPVADATRIGPVSTPEGLASCLTTLGEDDADQLAVDLATYAGQSALVVVVVKAGTKHVFAVAPGCSQGDPMILVGPLPMT